MNVQALNRYILQGIRKEVYEDRIELFIPFFFEKSKNGPLCLVWSKDGVLSDKGRTVSELKTRLGDLSLYRNKIQNVLNAFGTVSLDGGQNLVVRSFQTVISGGEEYKDYLGGLNKLLRAISQISIIDRIHVDPHGTVSIC